MVFRQKKRSTSPSRFTRRSSSLIPVPAHAIRSVRRTASGTFGCFLLGNRYADQFRSNQKKPVLPTGRSCLLYTSTGTDANREDFQRLLADVMSGKINCVIAVSYTHLKLVWPDEHRTAGYCETGSSESCAGRHGRNVDRSRTSLLGHSHYA